MEIQMEREAQAKQDLYDWFNGGSAQAIASSKAAYDQQGDALEALRRRQEARASEAGVELDRTTYWKWGVVPCYPGPGTFQSGGISHCWSEPDTFYRDQSGTFVPAMSRAHFTTAWNLHPKAPKPFTQESARQLHEACPMASLTDYHQC